ncbi:P22AR C-terminal domain-containing protein [Lonepinella koalarum]|uniref:P22AR C-terminal domain-containing protein n=1 Tax=Lonepinella koalarum TaxID=53417 RepID=UPI003F6DFC72
MSNQIFNFNSNPVRIEIFDNQPHFCLLDVCGIFEIQNSRRVQSQMLDPQGVRLAYTLAKDERQRRTAFINEPNLYRIIFRSEKPIAKEFQNWVFEEVLPQIRKTGQYAVQAEQLALPEPEPLISKSLTESEWLQFAGHWFALYNALDLLAELEQPLQAIGSRFAVTAYTHAREYANNLGLMKRILEPMLAEFEVDPIDEPFKFNALKTLREFKVKGLANGVKLSNQLPKPKPVKNYAAR